MPILVFTLLVFLTVGTVFLFIHLLMGKVIRPDVPEDEKLTIYECGEPTVGSAWVQFDLRYYVVALLFVVFDVEVAFFFPWAVVFGTANNLARELDGDVAAQRARLLRYANEDYSAEQALALSKFKLTPGTQEYDKAMEAMTSVLKAEWEKETKRLAGLSDADIAKEFASVVYQREFRPKNLISLPRVSRGGTQDVPRGQISHASEHEPINAGTMRSWAWLAFGDIMVFFGVLMVGFAYLWRRGDINWVRAVPKPSEAMTQPEPELAGV